MISLKEFHQDFLQSILSDAESRGLMKAQAFFENVCEELIVSGDLSVKYTFTEYIKTGIEVYGYDYDGERKILSLLVHNFFQNDQIETLTKSLINQKIKRLKNFFIKCTEGLHKQMEETSEAYSMAYTVNKYYINNEIEKVKLIVITDGKSTRNLKDLPSENIRGVTTEFRVIDIEYLYEIFKTQNESSEFNIDVKLPCLKINTDAEEYNSFLSVVNGKILVDIYEKHGQKLFEQNVRTFLQFRGKVNKGLRNTIQYSPEMFFAYNNGITATASEVEFNEKCEIIRIKNFQIVNGGQTTSAIYAASKKSKLDVSKVAVQMKLSVIKDKEKQGSIVSKISEYANTQNKVNKSDFFSNSEFHKEMKKYSQRIWVAAVGGSQRRTHWFYERVRGEYLNEQAYLNNTEKKKFKLENPKSQLVDKTFLAKSENAWAQKPHIVSKGAQYSFTTFAEDITMQLEKDNLIITESYFREAVARVILFRTLEKIVSKAEWYNGGYRANIVAYSMAYLSNFIENKGKFLNFDLIWSNQVVPEKLMGVLSELTKKIYNEIMSPPSGHANISQWCKQKSCWENIKTKLFLEKIDEELLVSIQDEQYNKKVERKNKKIESGIEIQMKVVQTDFNVWKELLGYYNSYRKDLSVTQMQLDLLKKMAYGKVMPPSEKQAKVLCKLLEDAKNDGFKTE